MGDGRRLFDRFDDASDEGGLLVLVAKKIRNDLTFGFPGSVVESEVGQSDALRTDDADAVYAVGAQEIDHSAKGGRHIDILFPCHFIFLKLALHAHKEKGIAVTSGNVDGLDAIGSTGLNRLCHIRKYNEPTRYE